MLKIHVDDEAVTLQDNDVSLRIHKDELKLSPDRREVLNRLGHIQKVFTVEEASKDLNYQLPIHTFSDYEIGREYGGKLLNQERLEGLVVVNTKDNSVFSVNNGIWKWGDRIVSLHNNEYYKVVHIP